MVDVRSQPYSSYATHFNAGQIKPMLADAGIQYVFLGEELGGRPAGAEFYDGDGHVLYDRVAESTLFLHGIERLEIGHPALPRGHDVQRGESRPSAIATCWSVVSWRAAVSTLWHIRADGRLQSQADLDRESGKGDDRQHLLFEELKEMPWRSIRSVLPKPPPRDSSES